MARVKVGITARKRHKKILDLAKGYRMARSTQFKSAQQAVLHAGEYAFMGRKRKKRDFRRLWITRMNAGLRELNSSYSVFIKQLREGHVEVDRKILSLLAAERPEIFKKIVAEVSKSK